MRLLLETQHITGLDGRRGRGQTELPLTPLRGADWIPAPGSRSPTDAYLVGGQPLTLLLSLLLIRVYIFKASSLLVHQPVSFLLLLLLTIYSIK
jgi:hypothetical protein